MRKKGNPSTQSKLPGIKDEEKPIALVNVTKEQSQAGFEDNLIKKSNPFSDGQEFFIPVSGFIWLSREEVEIVNHPTFQRLGNIYQLGQTYLVYRGATHKRLEHSLGTLNMVSRMIKAVVHTHKKNIAAKQPTALPLSESEEKFVRLGALLHDIGHLAAGHTLEDELGLLGKHDYDNRLKTIYKADEEKWKDINGMTLEQLIDKKYHEFIPIPLKGKISASLLSRLLIMKFSDKEEENDEDKEKENNKKKIIEYGEERKLIEDSNVFRLWVCRDMIGDTICADLLDYLYRDWYHIGKEKTFDERILQYMEIKPKDLRYKPFPEAKSTDKFVISLGKKPKIRTDAISSILDLLESRYQLAESVLFHRTKMAASAMLDRALYELYRGKQGTQEELERMILPYSDEQLISQSRKDSSQNRAASEILSKLEKRQLYKTIVAYGYDEIPHDLVRKIQRTYSSDKENREQATKNRATILKLLEQDFMLPEGSLAMHCPTGKMNVKIAKVCISVNDDAIDEFWKYEKNTSNHLSGGHLDAQIKRFERLWKIYFFISKDAAKNINDIMHLLEEAIKKLVIGNLGQRESLMAACNSIANSLASHPSSPWKKAEVAQDFQLAAYRKASDGICYPFGAPPIRLLLKQKNETT